MVRVLALVLLILAPAAPAQAEPHDGLVKWHGDIAHLFVHPLLPAPRYTLHKGTQPQEFAKWNITAREFRRILPQLYSNDYVLVDLESLVRQKQHRLRQAPLWLPPGKKPLVLSIDDLNYPQYMVDNHLNSKLVLDAEGRVAAQRVTPRGTTVVSRTSEVVPILDDFVRDHPDFSYAGAKGTIALTGAEGILGYRTSGKGRTVRRERVAAAPVVAALKASGWTFGSHSYSHIDMATSSMTAVASDTARWKRQVEPLIGPTDVFVYPFGAYPAAGSASFAVLRRAGFRIFCGITPTHRFEVHRDYAIQDRVRVDGLGLTSQQAMLKPYFDPVKVLDPRR